MLARTQLQGDSLNEQQVGCISSDVLLLKCSGLLQKYNASNATYLFQPDKLNVEYDLGDKTIQCGRRADAFKLWLTWKV